MKAEVNINSHKSEHQIAQLWMFAGRSEPNFTDHDRDQRLDCLSSPEYLNLFFFPGLLRYSSQPKCTTKASFAIGSLTLYVNLSEVGVHWQKGAPIKKNNGEFVILCAGNSVSTLTIWLFSQLQQ